MRIQHNIMAMNAYRNYTNNVSAMQKNLEKLSSGYKINRAGDDAAGLAISEKMRAQISGLEAAQKNAKDGISLVQTAEGALTEVHDMLNRMVTLATQSANGTYSDTTDREQLQKELDQLRTEIDRIADSSNFNGIKLFDGSLSGADITTTGIDTNQIDMASGVTVVQGGNGGGSKGEYTFDITSPFGAGDTIAFEFGGAANGAGTVTLTYAAASNGFKGETAEQQALSIASALSTEVGSYFSVTAEGTTIKLVSSKEGNDATEVGTVTNATVTNKTAKKDATWKQTAGVPNDTLGSSKFALLFNKGDGSGLDVPKGATISFEVTMSDTNNKMKVSLTEGVDFEVGQTINETAENVAAALKGKNFEDNADTVLDESKISVADMFDVAADNAGGLTFTNKTNSVAAAGIKAIGPNGQSVNSAAGTAVVAGDGAASSYLLKLDTSGAGNISIGDKLTIKGTLADGRNFKVEVEAGKDFKVDENATASTAFTNTLANLETLLETKGTKVQITDKDGNATGEVIDSTEIFGAAADGKEIDFDKTAAKFTSNRTGKVLVSEVTDVTLTAGKDSNVSKNLNNGAQKSAATSTVTFGPGLSYGATVEVGGQKYEIVRKADDITSKKNVAVVVDDISDANAVAKAMGEAIEGELSKSAYEVSVSGSKVTVSTTDIGSNVKAVTMSASGEKTQQTEFTLDPDKMQAGATVNINGQTYEFVNKGERTTSAGNTKIEINDISKSTAEELGKALASAANGVKNAYVGVDSDGKVTVRGLADVKGTVVNPTVKFDGGKGGLKLQIGDTADDFNQMKVSIYNMHCADMGIGNISIADQDSAQAAIDVIRSAINYVSDVRGTLGATQNRLDHTINNLSVMTENIQDAESTIRDVDVAEEMMAYTKNNILIQSAQAMLAQANQVPQGVLQLLG